MPLKKVIRLGLAEGRILEIESNTGTGSWLD
jgi:hypothetical protein